MANRTSTQDTTVPVNVPKKRKRNPNLSSGPREPRQKPVQCPICLVLRSPKLIFTLQACNCIWCVPCIREAFSISLQPSGESPNFPALCCGRVLDHIALENHLTPHLRRACKSKAEELISNEPLYCAYLGCRAYVLEEGIKNRFGSCGKCKRKTCIREECKRLKEEHLGIYAICPSFFEDEDLNLLAENKQWKRCPKCFALTERIRGCDGIRCICRTEWCYKCGKADKAKDACACHTKPAPPEQPQSAEVQASDQPEIIVIDDDGVEAENGHDSEEYGVRPSIEEVGEQPFFTESAFIAEMDRLEGLSTQTPCQQESAGMESSLNQPEPDVVEELDALVASNHKGDRLDDQGSEDRSSTHVSDRTSPAAQTSRATSYPSFREQLFSAANMEVDYPDLPVMVPSTFLDTTDHFNPPSDQAPPEPAMHQSSTSTTATDQEHLESVQDPNCTRIDQAYRAPQYCHTPAPETTSQPHTLADSQTIQGLSRIETEVQSSNESPTPDITSPANRRDPSAQAKDKAHKHRNDDDWWDEFLNEDFKV